LGLRDFRTHPLGSVARINGTHRIDGLKTDPTSSTPSAMPTTHAHTLSRLEPLESRIAPASITFTDIDNIQVTIKSSKGSAADLEQVAILAAEGTGFELQELRLSDLPDVFQGANISIVKGTLDDIQTVNVGFINASGLDLGKVTIDGDLGRILAGDDNSITAAAKSLTVGSVGVQGLGTQADGGNLISRFLGRLSSLTVKGDFKDANLAVLGIDPDPDEGSTGIDARGDIGDIFIGGDLIGGAETGAGSIYSKGSVGNIKIVGSVLGGAGDFSASITSERNMGKVEVGGDIRGGSISGTAVSDFSGRIFSAGGMGSVKLSGALRGGDGIQSGNITSGGVLGNVTILQGIFGGTGFSSGAVGTGGDIGKITVTGGITGGGGQQSGSIVAQGDMKAVKIEGNVAGGSGFLSGAIGADRNIASVHIEGSILGGGGRSSGAVGSQGNVGAVTVTGDLKGGTFQGAGAIGCFGKLGPISIGGNLEGGTDINAGVIAAGVSIAGVSIAGSMIGGDLEGEQFSFRTAIIDSPKIGSVTIGADIVGGEQSSSAAIYSQVLGNVKVGGDVKGGQGGDSGSIHAQRTMGDVNIGGSMIGGGGFFSGSILLEEFSGKGSPSDEFRGSIGDIKIGGSMQGGNNSFSGSILSFGTIASISVTGDLKGGVSDNSGVVLADDNIGPVKIGGNLEGDVEGGNSGRIRTFGKLASVTIEGDLIGGGGFYGDSTEGGGPAVNGQIASAGAMGTIIIKGSVKGGAGNNSAMINGGSIKSVLIEGDIDQAFGRSGCSVIASQGNLTSLTVKGSVNVFDNSSQSNHIVFGAADSIGSATFGALNGGTSGATGVQITAVNTIGKVTVENSAKFVKILAGYDTNIQPVKSDAKINKVIIGTTGEGNIQGVDIVAGVLPTFVPNMGGDFGTADDTPISPFSSDAVSRIGSVVIKGNVISTPQFFDHYGIVAGKIDAVMINGVALKLTPGLDVIEVTPTNPPVLAGTGQGLPQGDFTVREVSFSGIPSGVA
jgi:hypothetical protein